MSDNTYSGWTNYETWNVALWMNNDQGEQEYWIERAEELRDVSDLANEMQSQYEENTPTVTGCYADLLNASIRSVNWYEIAEHFIADLDPISDDELQELTEKLTP